MTVFVPLVLRLLLLLQLSSWSTVSAKLVASAILPHGDFAWDPTLAPPHSVERDVANKVARAARAAGAWLSKTVDPDIIFLSTPHGIAVSHDWAWYLASRASGYAEIGLDAPEYNPTRYRVRTEIDLAPNITQELLTLLKPQAVTGLLSFDDSEDMPLRWGEVVPLLLLQGSNMSASSSSSKRPRFVIVSHPLRRHKEAMEMIPELLTMGRSVRQWADASPLNVALLVSADLSHRHLANGPYGYSEKSVPMDAALGRWASNPWLYADELLVTAASLQSDALACGFTGMVLLHGALVRDHQSEEHWKTRVWVNHNVTYYGMMVATFQHVTQQRYKELQFVKKTSLRR